MCESKFIKRTEKNSNRTRLLTMNIRGTGKLNWRDKQGPTLYQERKDGLISESGLM